MTGALLTAAYLAWLAGPQSAQAPAASRPTRNAAATEALAEGVVVDSVPQGGAAAAGFQVGDILFSWKRAASPPANATAAGGRISSPFDLAEVQVEQASRGEVILSGSREGEPRTWVIPEEVRAPWTAPRFSGAAGVAYVESRRRMAAGELESGIALMREAAATLAREGNATLAIWMLYRLSALQALRGAWDAARAPLDDALRLATPRGDWRLLFHLEFARAQTLDFQGKLQEAILAYRRAIEIRRKLETESLSAALALSYLGAVAAQLGDLPAADEALMESLALKRRLAPASLSESESLTNLGIVRMRRGDLASAENLHRRALAIDQELRPDSLDIASDLTNLAGLAIRRGDPLGGADYQRRALEIRQRLAPDSPDVVESLQGLGAAWLDSDPAAAEESYRKGLAIQERLHSRADEIAQSTAGMAMAMWAARRDPAAEGHLRRALELQEKVAPGSQEYGSYLNDLANVLLGLSRPAEAEPAGRRALAILRRAAPGTVLEAEACHGLATVERRLRRADQAGELDRQALAALESQADKLGGSDQVRSQFSAKYAGYYRDYLDLLVELGQRAEAFHVLERYRARGFLDLLAERDLTFGRDLPADLERERRLANAEYDHALRQLAEAEAAAGPGSEPAGEEQEPRARQLQAARRRQEDVKSRIRAASPRLAALRYPQPLDLAATRQALDHGTLLLSYSIGKEESYLFAVGPEAASFQVLRLEATEGSLRDEVRRFRTFIEQSRGAVGRETVLRFAAPLTARLLAPAAPLIARAERLLILPDGPLHFLPFAALADPAATAAVAASSGPRGGETPRAPSRYLIEAKPIHIAASATVYAELRKQRRPRAEVRLVAFGDPVYSALPAGAAAGEGGAGAGRRLDPLPGTRAEVESLRKLFPGARVFLGAEATEERVKLVGKDASILHLACHGLLDERFPLESALVLTIPERPREGQDNGLLQAWEIFEQVRLDADLVTLSSCQSAIGKEMEGEGLMGLTRAFQFAGARSVLASLWQIGDASTGELMRRFYGYLQAGKAKDEALRLAQLDLLREPIETTSGATRTRLDASHPFHWAAFELLGDRL